jgi:hypothetical protein
LVSLQEHLQAFSYSVAEHVTVFENVAEAINWRKTVYEKPESGDSDLAAVVASNEDDETRRDRLALTEPTQQVQQAFATLQEHQRQLLQALDFCYEFLLKDKGQRDAAARKRRLDLVILHYLEVSGFLPAFITFLHMGSVVQELSIVLERHADVVTHVQTIAHDYEEAGLALFRSFTLHCPIVNIAWIKHATALKRAFGIETPDVHRRLLTHPADMAQLKSLTSLATHIDLQAAIHATLAQFIELAPLCPEEVAEVSTMHPDQLEALLQSGNKLLDLLVLPYVQPVVVGVVGHAFQHALSVLLGHFMAAWEPLFDSGAVTTVAQVPFVQRFIINVIVEALSAVVWDTRQEVTLLSA